MLLCYAEIIVQHRVFNIHLLICRLLLERCSTIIIFLFFIIIKRQRYNAAMNGEQQILQSVIDNQSSTNYETDENMNIQNEF